MTGAERNPYQVLGLGAGATSADVSRAWRRLARAMHPDSRPGDPDAAEQFRVLSEAYELLSDPVRRAAWDHRHRDPSASRRASPGQQAPADQAFWPFPPAGAPWPAAGRVPGATLRAGPVHIQPPAPDGSAQADPDGDPDLARLLARLAPPWQEWPW